MAIKKTREFAPSDRYRYDFGLCSYKNGFAQFDTRQDASYFGNWLNPEKRIFFSYTEGDTTTIECDTDEEFAAYVRETFAWYVENDGQRPGIDPGFSPEMKASFDRLGLGDLLH